MAGPEHDYAALWQEVQDAEAADSRGPWIEAHHYGTCVSCGYRWEPGESIRADDDAGGWVCSDCGAGEP